MIEDLHFQKYAHDKLLGGSSPSVDSGPRRSKNLIVLAPSTFHSLTVDVTLSWELEQAIAPLKDLLV